MLLVSVIGYFEVKVYGAEKLSKPERQQKTSIQPKQNQGGDGALPCADGCVAVQIGLFQPAKAGLRPTIAENTTKSEESLPSTRDNLWRNT